MSPTIFRAKGFRFYFFSREETRMHVHVQHAEGEAKFWLEPDIELAHAQGLGQAGSLMPRILSGREPMKSAPPGKPTSPAVEVLNLTQRGLWLFVSGEELFLSFDDFPWFRDAKVSGIMNVRMPGPDHLYWPDLDIDLSVESIRKPELFPLVSEAKPSYRAKKTAPKSKKSKGQ